MFGIRRESADDAAHDQPDEPRHVELDRAGPERAESDRGALGRATPLRPAGADGDAVRERFEDLFRSTYDAVREYAARQVGLGAAEDVAAETFTTAWSRRANAPQDADAHRAWIFGIARNKVHERRRSSGRQRATEARVLSLAAPLVDEPSYDVAALDRVQRLLDRLPDDQRETLLLTVVAHLTPAEAGDVLGCSASAVTSRIHRAKATLQVVLDQEGGAA